MGIIEWCKQRLLPGKDWSLDVDLRYLPVARFLDRNLPQGSVLEIGASRTGITPYLPRTIIGCDVSFPPEITPMLVPVVARGTLPFREESFDAVISLDTLEHVPREARQLFIDEMFRVSRRYIVAGFPEGEAAERHDGVMEAYYKRHRVEAHEYFLEHRQFRIPRREEAASYLAEAARKHGRAYNAHRVKNVNVLLRSLFMRTVWSSSPLLQKSYTLLTALSRWDSAFHHGTCYRSIYFVTLD